MKKKKVNGINELLDYKQKDIIIDTMNYSDLASKCREMFEVCKLYDEIIENVPDGIYITDGNANAIRINAAFERISGLKRSELLGCNHRDLVKNGIIPESCAIRVLEEKKPATIIHKYIPTNRTALDTCNPVFDEQGNIKMTVSSIRDLTELNDLREKLEQEKTLRNKLERELEELRSRFCEKGDMIVQDKKMLDVVYLADRVAKVNSTVLLTGETGVGKEEVAKYIHNKSLRSDFPFIVINCGAIPESLVESELFGYEKGAFTGAQQDGKIGLLEVANKGTVFFDEIGELPLDMQVKILRAIQSKAISRLGGTKIIELDIRIICATNRNLKEMVKEHRFREDLYYRLSVVPIHIPPLRERTEDIIPIANRFLENINQQYRYKKTFSSMVYRILYEYSWPGNVRELKNVVERAVVTSESDIITTEDLTLNEEVKFMMKNRGFSMGLKEHLEMIEYNYITEAYNTYHSVRKASKYLGMTMPTYVRKRKEYEKKYSLQK